MKKLNYRIVQFWSFFQEHVYGRSEEVSLQINPSVLSKEMKGYHAQALWHSHISLLFVYVSTLLAWCAWEAINSQTVLNGVGTGIWDWESVLSGVILYLMLVFLFAVPLCGSSWLRRDNTVRFTRGFMTDEVKDLLERYRWFYFDDKVTYRMVFTNRNPIFFLRILERFPCQYDWSKPVRKDLLTWLIICVLEPLLFQQIYLRVIWPYLINPFQLAFLSYDEAAKTVDLKEGERVLVLGAGAVPHHIRWKRRLGARGWIVALDDNPYVLRDSRRIEALIEWLRGLLRLQRREVTKYVRADNLTLPFPDASFDAVIAIRCYVINVDEAKRVLKPGGRLVVICCGEVRGKDLHHQAGLQVTYDGFVLTI